VREILIGGAASIEEVWLAEGKDTSRTREIVKIAEEAGIPVRVRRSADLHRVLPHTAHQGIVAVSKSFSYTDVNQLADGSLEGQVPALLIVADHITDEGNLGAIIRAGAFFGAHGLILPKDRSARVTPNVVKRSSGAYRSLRIARVVNIGRTLDLLLQKNFWIIGTSGRGSDSIYDVAWDRDTVLILGSEQKGISPSALKRCHQVVRIPSAGKVESLNVGVACGVILSEIFRSRAVRKTPRDAW